MPYHHYSFSFTGQGGGGGNRLLWFILGGIATALFMKGRERRNAYKALPPPGPFSTPESAHLRERLARMNIETSEAAIDVADATLDAALKIVTALKSTLVEQRVETEQMKRQAAPQVNHMPGPSARSPSASPSFIAEFHHVQGTS
ncbi:hypothetical protein RhiJN_16228 [Ceratobasidium sp. AG-Ba]|nr:hypothetical protein RhiJN_16228 [Ceratobasidium sp. AG-Ba]